MPQHSRTNARFGHGGVRHLISHAEIITEIEEIAVAGAVLRRVEINAALIIATIIIFGIADGIHQMQPRPRHEHRNHRQRGGKLIGKEAIQTMVSREIAPLMGTLRGEGMLKDFRLPQYVFLEHGAHYAIGALALIMLASMKWHIPELLTGLIGIALIVLSVWSSIRHQRQQKASVAS